MPPVSEPAPRPRAGGPTETAGRRAGSAWAYVAIARPDHWFKNAFMAAGAVLAYFCHPAFVGRQTPLVLLAAFAAVCLLASSNYVLNEILDAPSDRHHPVKRSRPVPSGQVRLPWAYAEWLLLGALGLALAFAVNVPFACAGAFLLLMGLVYNVPPARSKDWPYLDVLSEAVNNPVRLLLGWFAVTAHDLPPLSLLLSYWMIGAFFMATKRWAELRSLGSPALAAAYRRSFRHYDGPKLLISMFFYATSFALFLGVFIIRYHLELILAFPLVAGFLCSYLRVAFKPHSAVQHPERLYREPGLMLYLAVCLAAFFLLMFTDVPVLYRWFNVPAHRVPKLWTF
jgi:4-hydroxybenzoate polyprenyltransferase